MTVAHVLLPLSCAAHRVYNQDGHKNCSHKNYVDDNAGNDCHSLRLRCAMAKMTVSERCDDVVSKEAEEDDARWKQAESCKDEPGKLTSACLIFGVGFALYTEQTR